MEPWPLVLGAGSLSHCTTREVQGPVLQHGWQGLPALALPFPSINLFAPLPPGHMEHIYLPTHTGVFRPPFLPSAHHAGLGQVVESSGYGLSSNGVIIPVLPPPCRVALGMRFSFSGCFLIGLMRKLNTFF